MKFNYKLMEINENQWNFMKFNKQIMINYETQWNLMKFYNKFITINENL